MPSAAAALFGQDAFWRDLIAFTWNIKTLEGRDAIRDMLEAQLPAVRPRHWELDEAATEAGGVTEAWISFETEVARGRGHLRLKGDEAWTLLTTARELKGFEEKQGAYREKGVEHGIRQGRRSWLDRQREEQAELGVTRQPYCLVIGGGQGGIALGARLKRLGVPTLIVDKHERPGDQWRSRYKSLHLHDPVWYDHLPYLPFPDHWPVFASKDKIGDWLEMYTKVMELNYWSRTECRSARYDAEAQEWTVELTARRRAGDASPEATRARHRHVGHPEPAGLCRHGGFRGREPSFEPPPRRRPLPRQAGRGDRVQQLGA